MGRREESECWGEMVLREGFIFAVTGRRAEQEGAHIARLLCAETNAVLWAASLSLCLFSILYLFGTYFLLETETMNLPSRLKLPPSMFSLPFTRIYKSWPSG